MLTPCNFTADSPVLVTTICAVSARYRQDTGERADKALGQKRANTLSILLTTVYVTCNVMAGSLYVSSYVRHFDANWSFIGLKQHEMGGAGRL